MSDNKIILPQTIAETIAETSGQVSIKKFQEIRLTSNDIESNQIKTKVIDINDTKIKSTDKRFNFSEECGSCIMCGTILLALGIIGCAITYIVYMIMSICQTSYNEQKDICNKSNAWLYLLLSLIINVIVGSAATKSQSSDNSKYKSNISCKIILQIFTCVTFLIWGCVELFGVECVGDLKSTLLYTMLQVTVITNIVVGCISLIIGLVTGGLFCCAEFNR